MAGTADSLKDYTNSVYDGSSATYYSASFSQHLQGVELTQPWQIFSYTVPKIRGNSSFVTTVDSVRQDQNFFDDRLIYESLGNSSSGSQVNIGTAGTLGVVVDHRAEKRDFGFSLLYEDGSPFREKENVERITAVSIRNNLSSSQIPLELRQIGNSPVYYDGIIEPLQIRGIADRSAKDLKAPLNSIRGSLMLEEPNPAVRESRRFVDLKSLKDTPCEPYFDNIKLLNNKLPMPSTSSVPTNKLYGFVDSNDREKFYYSGSIDDTVRNRFLSGLTISGELYKVPKPNFIGTDEIYSSRGFTFSQVDNYKYDSIAFAGTNRNNRI